jgi:hypothetical protein
MVQRIVIAGGQRIQMLGQDLFKSIPEGLRGEAFRWNSPGRMQNGAAVPIGHFGLGSRLTDAVDSGQQQIAGRRGTGSGRGPERLQYVKETRLLGGEPESARQSKVARGGGQRDRGSAVFEQSGDFVSGPEIGLVDDAGLAIDAGAFDDVVVELVAFFLGDEGGHIG